MTDVVDDGTALQSRRVHLLKNEWVALVLLGLHILLGLFWVELMRSWWIMALFPAGLLWVLTVLLIIPTFGDSRDLYKTSEQARTLLAVPLTIAAVILLNFVTRIPQRVAASVYLARHETEMAQAVAAAQGKAASNPYYSGIPDGGIVIVQLARGRPEQLGMEEQARLTGEGIDGCDRIIGGWMCGYD